MTGPIEDHEDMFDFAEKVTVTMDPEAHAALEALLVAVARWDASERLGQHGDAAERLRWQYRQYRDALDAQATF
jgi:hypothetical protein